MKIHLWSRIEPPLLPVHNQPRVQTAFSHGPAVNHQGVVLFFARLKEPGFDTYMEPAEEGAARIGPWRDAELTKAVHDQPTCINMSRRRRTVTGLALDEVSQTDTGGNMPKDGQLRLASRRWQATAHGAAN